MSTRRRRPPAWIPALSVLAALLLTALVALIVTRRAGPAESPPPSATAPATIASPHVVRLLCEETLPALVVALNAVGRGRPIDDQYRKVLEEALRLSGETPPILRPPFARLIDDASRATTDSDANRGADRLAQAVVELNRALLAAEEPYYFDSEMTSRGGSRVVLLFVFRVERSRWFEIGGDKVRALYLRRADKLNWQYALLAYAAAGRSETSVLLDRVEEILVRRVLPALAEAEGTGFWEENETFGAKPWYRQLEKRAAAAARAQLLGPAGEGPLLTLCEILARRRALIAGWNRALAARDTQIEEPTGIDSDLASDAELKGLVDPLQLAELEQLESRLDAPELRAEFEAIRNRFAESLARHEVQHVLDQRALAKRAAAEPTRAVAETSAYLAELARDDGLGALNLALLAGYLFPEPGRTSAESEAARAILAALAGELAVSGAAAIDAKGSPSHAAEVYARIFAAEASARKHAAEKSWERLFGGPLAVVK